jgi:hypothetical protein
MRWSLRSYGPAPTSLSNSSSTTTWMVARTASRHRAVRSCSKSACVGTMRSVASARRDRFGLFTGGSPWSRNPEIRPSFVVGQPTRFYTTIGTRPYRPRTAGGQREARRSTQVAAGPLGVDPTAGQPTRRAMTVNAGRSRSAGCRSMQLGDQRGPTRIVAGAAGSLDVDPMQLGDQRGPRRIVAGRSRSAGRRPRTVGDQRETTRIIARGCGQGPRDRVDGL